MVAMRWLWVCACLGSCAVPADEPPKMAPPPAATAIPKPPPPARKLQLTDLKSLNARQLQSVIGVPSLDRREGALRIMQFTSGICVSDMVFNAAGEMVHVETRAKTGTPIETQPCLDSFDQILPGS